MHILQPVLSRSRIAQVAHIQLPVAPSAHLYRLEHLGDGILALSPFAMHIFFTHRSIHVDAGDTRTLLTAIVLFLHHQIELVQSVAACAVLLHIIVHRLQQANHRHATFMLQLFHIRCMI